MEERIEKLIKELQFLDNDLFLAKCKAPFKWLEDEIQQIRFEVNAVIETLKEIKQKDDKKEK